MTDKHNSLTRADRVRKVKQEGLRELLSKQKHIEHVIDLAGQIEKVASNLEDDQLLTSDDVKRLKASMDGKRMVIETKMKLVNKYLGDVKSVEHSGEVKQTVIDDRNVLETMLRDKGIDPENIRPN